MTNHMRVLLCLAEEPTVRVRDIADRIEITERAAQRIIADLAEAGYITRERVGRRNRYTVNRELALRHVSQLGQAIGPLLDVAAIDKDSSDSNRTR